MANELLWDAVVAKDTEAAKAALRDGAEPNTFRFEKEVPKNSKEQLDLFYVDIHYHGVIYDMKCDVHDIGRVVADFLVEAYGIEKHHFTPSDDLNVLSAETTDMWCFVKVWTANVAKDLGKVVRVNDDVTMTFRCGPDTASEDDFGYMMCASYEKLTKKRIEYKYYNYDYNYDMLLLHEHRNFVSVMMVAAQQNDIPMLEVLLEAGAEVNLRQPVLIEWLDDGAWYGKMSPLCFALACPETTQWFLTHGAEVDIQIEGLPGREDIPCSEFTPLLLACEITKNDAVCRLLVEAGADVNYAAARNNGFNNRDDIHMCCYWRSVVASGDVVWARRLLEEFDAVPTWPRFFAVNYDEYDRDDYHGVCCPHGHEGFRETVLMTAVAHGDVAMIKLLVAHLVSLYPGDIEHINMECILEYFSEAITRGVGKSELLALCLNRRANAFSLAIGKAQVPDAHLLVDGDMVVDVLEPYRSDPVLTALRDCDYYCLPQCHVAAARDLTKNVHDIMPTYEEICDDVADLSAEKRALYFRVKKERLDGGATEEFAKHFAREAVEEDPEYEEDASFGKYDTVSDDDEEDEEGSEEERGKNGGSDEEEEEGSEDCWWYESSTDDEMSVDLDEEVYEFSEDGYAIIMDVDGA
jgi:hypothetical protein